MMLLPLSHFFLDFFTRKPEEFFNKIEIEAFRWNLLLSEQKKRDSMVVGVEWVSFFQA